MKGKKVVRGLSLLLVVILSSSMLTTVAQGQSLTPEIISFSASPPSPVMVGTEVTLTAEVSGGGIVVDQSSVGGSGGTQSWEMGQTFTPASNNLAAVDLDLCVWAWPSAERTITVKIFDGYWWQGANLLGSKTVTTTLYPIWNWTAIYFEFDDPIPVTPGQLYVMQVIGDVIWRSGYNLYPNGKAIHGHTPQLTGDFAFKTYTRTDPQIRFSTDGGDSWSEWSYEVTFSWITDEQDIGTNTLLAQASDGVNQVTSYPIFYEVLPTISWAIEDIKEKVVNKGIQISLIKKLEKAVTALDGGNFDAFEKSLNVFIKEAEAQKGKMIDEGYATLLVDWGTGWIQLLGQA